jgi:hypothetical protein
MVDVSVVYQTLRDEAAAWDNQQADLQHGARQASELAFTGLQFGIFAPINGAYMQAQTFLTDRLNEAVNEFEHISGDLRLNADAYEGVDQEQIPVFEHVPNGY